MMRHVIAIDLGATSGRVIDVQFDGKKIALEQLHRFMNLPVTASHTLYWDVLSIWREIQEGLERIPDQSASIGVDTWGVDFALLDRNGQLLSNPIHYRDRNRDGVMEWVFERVPRREIFARTGIQFMQLNGLYQLAEWVRHPSPLLETAHTLLTLPDLFNYWLTGTRSCEFTDVTTLQFYNPTLGDWDRDLLTQIGIPTHFLTDIVMPGTRLGTWNNIPVIAPATHDTGSAVVAVPSTTSDFAYLSSGTWSLLGLELEQAVMSDRAYEANLTNEGGYGGTYRLLKNIMGLWLIEQSLATWTREGATYRYEDFPKMIHTVADPFRSMIDPDDMRFFSPGDIPSQVRAYCEETNQPVPITRAEVLTCIHVSMAMKYRHVLTMLLEVANHHINRLYIIGGGSRNHSLNQMTANAIGLPVLTGAAETTAIGNGVVQLIALGELGSLAQARQMLADSIKPSVYEPTDTARWTVAYQRFVEIIHRTNQTY